VHRPDRKVVAYVPIVSAPVHNARSATASGLGSYPMICISTSEDLAVTRICAAPSPMNSASIGVWLEAKERHARDRW
jgi:hypothetical protein